MNLRKGKNFSAHKWIPKQTNTQTNKTFIKIKTNLLTEKDKSEKEIHR